MKVSEVVKKETVFIAIGVFVLSGIMVLIFLLLGKFNLSVIYSALLSSLLAILNFFLLGLSLQKAVKKDEKDVRAFVRTSYTYRMIVIFVIFAICLYSGAFSPFALLIPLVFPRIAILFKGLVFKKVDENE